MENRRPLHLKNWYGRQETEVSKTFFQFSIFAGWLGHRELHIEIKGFGLGALG